MQQTPFICRSCLLRLRQTSRAVRRTSRTSPFILTSPSPLTPHRFLGTEASSPSKYASYEPLLRHQNAGTERKVPSPARGLQNGPDTATTTGSRPTEGPGMDNLGDNAEDSLDTSAYAESDTAFWEMYDKIWKDEGDAETPVQKLQTATESSPVGKKVHRKKHAITQARPRFGVKYHNWQWGYVEKISDPKKVPLLLKEFKTWKRNLQRIKEARGAELSRWMTSKLDSLLQCSSVEDMRAVWAKDPLERRARICTYVVAAALEAAPEKAHLVLEAVYQDPMPPPYLMQDTLDHLAERLTQLPHDEQKGYAERLAETILFLLDQAPRDAGPRQNTVFRVLTRLERDGLVSFYRGLCRYQYPLHTYTRLQFASRFAKDPKTKEISLEVLEETLQSRKLDINTPHGASLCTSILIVKEEDLEADNLPTIKPAQMFQWLLDCGMRPNLITYTAIIRNLCLTGELNAAWQVFDIMTRHQIPPDAYVYSTLMNGAKLASDLPSLRRVVCMAHIAKIREPIVWNDFLHAMFLSSLTEARHRGMKPPRILPVFGPMLRLYARFFKVEPLMQILPIDMSESLRDAERGGAGTGPTYWSFTGKYQEILDDMQPLPPDERMTPDTATLTIMLVGYIRSLSRSYQIMAFYSHFRKLVKAGNSVVGAIIEKEGTLVHGIVIKALTEWPGLLRVALDIVGDMMKDNSPRVAAAGIASPALAPVISSSGDTANGDLSVDRSLTPLVIPTTSRVVSSSPMGPRHPAPDVYTWSILLDGFLRNRLRTQSERILQLMHEHGVAPNLVTWNTLAAGYARMQSVDKTVTTLRQLEAAGHVPDDFTMKAFSYLRNKNKALQKMEAVIERKKARQLIGAQEGEDSRQDRLEDMPRLEQPNHDADVDSLESTMEELALEAEEEENQRSDQTAWDMDDEVEISHQRSRH